MWVRACALVAFSYLVFSGCGEESLIKESPCDLLVNEVLSYCGGDSNAYVSLSDLNYSPDSNCNEVKAGEVRAKLRDLSATSQKDLADFCHQNIEIQEAATGTADASF